MGYIDDLDTIVDSIDNVTLPSKSSLTAQTDAIKIKIAEYNALSDGAEKTALDAEIRALTSTLANDTRAYISLAQATLTSLTSLRAEHQLIRGKVIASHLQKQHELNTALPLMATEIRGLNTEVSDYFRDGLQANLLDQYAWDAT